MGTDYRSMYDKDYIGAWDLQDRDVVVTITRVVAGQLTGQGGRKAKKPVVYMKGTEKGFALNATNGKAIAAMYGNHVEGWVGKRIALYKSTTRNPNGDGEVECIRVRPTVPPPKKQQQADDEGLGTDTPSEHSAPLSSLGDADATGASPKPAGSAPAPSESEALQLLVHDWIESIGGCADADAVSRMAEKAPEKVKTRDEFAKAVRARLDSLKERRAA